MKPIVRVVAERIARHVNGLKVKDFCVCLKAAYVVVEDAFGEAAVGVAHVPLVELHGTGDVRPPTKLEELPELVTDLNPITRVLAVAAMNAVSQYVLSRRGVEEGDILRYVVKEPVCVVGHMPPLVNKLKQRGLKFYVFEKTPTLRAEYMSDAEEYLLIPTCRTNVITGMTLLNFTIDTILRLSKGLNILVGPTAGALPEAFKDTGVHVIYSLHITKVNELVNHLKLGNFVSVIYHKRFGTPYVHEIDPLAHLKF